MGDMDENYASPLTLPGETSKMMGKTSPTSLRQSARPLSEASDSRNPSQSPEPDEADTKSSVPIQKRRRVTRACDECRRKKIKCDGKQPCTHCTVYSYECTYDQPSNRRRNPAPQYIEALEQRLQKSEAILRAVLPGIDIDDPKFDAHGVEQLVEAARTIQPNTSLANTKPEEDPQMRSMVDQTGSLDLDDTGHWDFHGSSSTYLFMARFRAKFGDSLVPVPKSPERKTFNLSVESPKSVHSSVYDLHTPSQVELPSREAAFEHCRAAIDVGCALTRPFHRPTFFRRLTAVYETDPEHWDTEIVRFVPLMYAVMSFGCLFSPGNADTLDQKGYRAAIEQGYHWFNASKTTIDITDCRDLMGVQTVVFMILFLQSSAKLATCYSYIGIALRACCRLGMHRTVTANFTMIEQEERKRAFWLIRNLDTYVGTMLGLPQMLADDDIDQQHPAEVHDDYIQENAILPMPPNIFPLLIATNAHNRLVNIMKKVLVYVYPLKPASPSQNGRTYTIGHSRIKELERDLQAWMDNLPMELRPSGNADTELSRVQQLLRMSYAYVQITMYRPFLHYVSPTCQQARADKRSFACAAACVSVARNVVHITSEMRRRGLLGGAYWFVMYITYFAILSLVYFVLENPESSASQDILKDAREGHETLLSLSKRSFAADRCTQSLKSLFEELPEKLKERRSSLQSTPNISRKRAQPESGTLRQPQASSVPRGAPINTHFGPPPRARTLPHDYLSSATKRNSLPDSPANTPQSFHSNTAAPDGVPFDAANSSLKSSPQATPSVTQLDWSMPPLQQGNFPDLQNVMFPSDNPFAYGNQPIMTLEDTSFEGTGEMPNFGTEQYSGTPENSFPTPRSLPNQNQNPVTSQSEFDMGNLSGFAQPFDRSASQTGVFEGTQQNMFAMPADGKQADDYWTGAEQHHHHRQQQGSSNRMQFRPGAGFSQNPPGVNLDELFGGGNGWGSVNMVDMGMMNNQPGGVGNNGSNIGRGGTGWTGPPNWM